MPLNQPYPARNYALGEYLLTLRSRTKLTQAELAARVGVHRRSVQKWESGETYPAAENLRPLIEVLLNLGGFPPGEERTAAADLWQRVSQGSPQQFPLFDTAWLDQVLAVRRATAPSAPPPTLVDHASASRREASPGIDPPVLRDPRPALTLPFQPTPFVGRVAELSAIAKLLTDPACRLLTLFGPGGIGKTRLALEIAARHRHAFRDGVVFVDLAAVGTPDQIVAALGDALNLSLAGAAPTPSDPTTHLLGYLRDRQLLLLLDDFEHLLEGADLVSDLLAHAPEVTILITSRARLNLQAEWLFDVEGLAYPTVDLPGAVASLTVTDLASYSAVQLFVQRALQLQPGLSQSETTLSAIGRICQQVAGMPLAIELAAASVRSLPIAEIDRQIRANLDGLATALRDVPARHRSLRAVFDHSWDLLSEAERVVLSRLAIFRGGWNQAAAEAICAYIGRQIVKDSMATLTLPFLSVTFSPALLAALVDKSLVRSASGERSAYPTAEPRFVLLEPIREYALAQLAIRGEAALLQRAHAIYYLEVAEAAVAQWVSPTADAAIAQLDRERDNLRAVLQWARDGGDVLIGLQLAGALIKFWRRRGAHGEGRTWLEELLAVAVQRTDPTTLAVRLRALQAAAWLASDQHDYARATQLFEQSMALRRALGETEDQTNLLVNAGIQARAVGHYRQATALLEEALAQQRALGNRGSLSGFGLGLSLFLLGLVQREQGNFEQATQLFEECIELHRALGDREGSAVGLLALSDIARDQGDVTALQQYATESLAGLRALGAQWAIGFALNNLALAAYLVDDLPQAKILISESVALFRTQQADGSLAEVLITQGQILAAQRELATAHAAFAEAVEIACAIGPRLLVAPALELLAGLALQSDPGVQGATLAVPFLAAASGLRTQMNTSIRPVDQPAVERTLAITRSTLGPDAFATHWAAALLLPLESILSSIAGAAAFSTPVPRVTDMPVAPTPATETVVPPVAESTSPSRARLDWGLAQDVPVLYGRAHEVVTLTQWVMTEQCRVITLVGLGGIGKTSLAVSFARQVAPHFTTVIFRSLGEAPPLSTLLDQLIYSVGAPQIDCPPHLPDKLALLVDLLRQARCLLILDNLETIMQAGTADTQYLAGYEGYGNLFKVLGATAHQSCLILTSRERVREVAALEGPRAAVRTLALAGLAQDACRALIADQDLSGSAADAQLLAHSYGGNPLALRLVADPIRALFGGDIAAFLREGNLFFNGVGHLLAEQIGRATALEQLLLTWLAIAREPIHLDELMDALAGAPTGGDPLGTTRTMVLAALHGLWRRNLIELGQAHLTFTLQRVVLEFLTDHLIERAAEEILGGNFEVLMRHPVAQATVKDYVRHSQERLIAIPLLSRLLLASGNTALLAQRLLTLLEAWRDVRTHSAQSPSAAAQGYGPGNVINLLRLLRGNLCGLDLSSLAIRQVNLQGTAVQDTSLAGALIQDTLFTETFDAMIAVAISRNGEYWAAGSRRGEVVVWTANGRIRHYAWQAHADRVRSLAFSPDGRTLVTSGSWDGTLKLWDVASGTLRWLGRHPSYTNLVAFAPDGSMLASSGNDATIRLWDPHDGTLLQTLLHPAPMSAVTWIPATLTTGAVSAHLLASGDAAGYIRLWKIEGTAPAICVQTLAGHTTYIEGLAFAPDGMTLASASWDGTVKLWDTSTALSADVARGALRQTLTGHTQQVVSITWSPDGRTLASAGRDQTIWLWDSVQGDYRSALQAHTGDVNGLAFTPDSRNLLSSSEDGTLRVWEIESRQCVRLIQGFAAALCDVDWSPDSARLVSGGSDMLVTLFDRMPSTPGGSGMIARPSLLSGHTGVVIGIGWNATGQYIASSEWNNAIRLWDATSGVCLKVIQDPDDSGNFFDSLAWSPDGHTLAVGTYRQGVLVWGLTVGHQRWPGQKVDTWIRHVAWSPDGSLLAGGGADGSVYVWDTASGTLLHRLAGHQSTITSVAWSPNGAQLASGSSSQAGGELFLWEPKQGARLQTIAGQPGMVYGVAWGTSEDVVITGGRGGRLRWWDVQRGACVRINEAHEGTVQSLRRSPDGTQLASCGDDGAIMLWDLRSGEYLQTLRRDRPYERLDITDLTGITAAQRATLLALGAIEQPK